MKFRLITNESDVSENTLLLLKTQNRWKAKFLDVISKQEILRKARFETKDEQTKMFLIIAYLTSGRRNEIASLRKVDIKKETYFYAPEQKNYDVYVFNMLNEKNQNHKRKYIPIVQGLDPTIDIMLKEVELYLEERADFLFDKYHTTIWNQRLKQITLRARYIDRTIPITENVVVDFQLFPHYLRHCRLSHLSQLGSQVLLNISGWSSAQANESASAKVMDTYIRRTWQMVTDAMIRNRVG